MITERTESYLKKGLETNSVWQAHIQSVRNFTSVQLCNPGAEGVENTEGERELIV